MRETCIVCIMPYYLAALGHFEHSALGTHRPSGVMEVGVAFLYRPKGYQIPVQGNQTGIQKPMTSRLEPVAGY
jgi:hypothetical protein